MRLALIVGILLTVFGVIALGYQSFTFFTQEKVVDAGFFEISASRPHTIYFNPILGGLSLVTGLILVSMGVMGARKSD